MKLIWKPWAKNAVMQGAAYMLAENPNAAILFVDRIEERVASLCEHPYLGIIGRVDATRELMMTDFPYCIIYRLHHDVIEIIDVIHMARRS